MDREQVMNRQNTDTEGHGIPIQAWAFLESLSDGRWLYHFNTHVSCPVESDAAAAASGQLLGQLILIVKVNRQEKGKAVDQNVLWVASHRCLQIPPYSVYIFQLYIVIVHSDILKALADALCEIASQGSKSYRSFCPHWQPSRGEFYCDSGKNENHDLTLVWEPAHQFFFFHCLTHSFTQSLIRQVRFAVLF